MSTDWFRSYFAEPYGEVYEEYLLPPSVAAQESEFACDALELGPGDAVLDCPCGFGRHLDHLCHLFPDIVGLDLDRDCLERAALLPCAPRLVRGDMRSLPFATGRFDAVLNLFNSFGYFSDEANASLLGEFARVLAPAGRLLIDVANPGPLVELIEEQSRTQVQVHDLLMTEEWRYDAKARVLHNETTIDLAGARTQRSYALRLYARDELEAMLDRAGFDLAALYGDFDHEPFDEEESARLILIAKRRAIV